MALSDWDVLAIDENGRPSNGTSEASPAGILVEIHEGQLQIVSPDLWQPNYVNPRPIIGTLTHGEGTFGDIRLIAEQCGRNGLLWATWFYRGAELVSTVGMTCDGFDEARVYTGITTAETAALAAALAAWSEADRVPMAMAALNFGNVLRFNQGDAYFSRKMHHALEATPPGQADMPILYQPQRGRNIGRTQVNSFPIPNSKNPI